MLRRNRPLGRRLLVRRERGVIRRVAEAHRWMEEGNFERAADRFSRLAVRASRRGLPIASQLLVQAGRAYAGAGQIDAAEISFGRGFEMMSQEDDPRLGPVCRQVLAELRRDGHSDLADRLAAGLPAGPALAGSAAGGQAAPPHAKRLPAKCPFCGGSVITEQVDRTDPERPGCAYCGSPLLEEGPDDG
jgi:hypothetical protein